MAKPTGPLNLKEVVACQPLLFVCVGGGEGSGEGECSSGELAAHGTGPDIPGGLLEQSDHI